jgi:hypothetical protein
MDRRATTGISCIWVIIKKLQQQGKQVELTYNQGCLREFKTAFDGEMEAMADIMDYVYANQIPGYLTTHSDAKAAIARVSYTGTGPGQDVAIRVVKAVQGSMERGWRTRIECIPGHSGIGGNDRADQLASEATAGKKTGRTSIAWLRDDACTRNWRAQETSLGTARWRWSES